MLKKTNFLVLLSLSVSCTAMAQKVVFSGVVDKKFDGNKIFVFDDNTKQNDSTTIKNGKFVIATKFKEPAMYFILNGLERKTARDFYSPLRVIVSQPGTIKVDANMDQFGESKVTGSEDQDLMQKYMAQASKISEKMANELNAKYGKEFVQNPGPDSSAKYKEFIEDYSRLSESSMNDQKNNIKNFIKENSSSFVAVVLLQEAAQAIDVEEVESLFNGISPKFKKTSAATPIIKTINAAKNTAIGVMALDFTQADVSGNPVKLSSFRGQYVLLDFWASWCGPCRAENPNVVKAYNKFKDKGFTVLGVSLDQPGGKDAWLEAIQKDQLTWTQVSDLKGWSNEAAVLYGIRGIPANFLLDKEGKIIAKDLRGEELEKKLTELLGE